jgi:uncharacterized protein (DUF1501 family)
MSYSCGGHDHGISRRQMLGLLAGAAGGILAPSVARALQSKQRQVLMIWLDGGMSQLESWDPKPGTDHGGPFRAIPTSVPGVQVSELMPHTAKRVHKLAVIRSMATKDNSHSIGVGRMHRGDPVNRGVEYPYLGSAIAKLMDKGESGLPPYVWIKPGSSGFVAQHGGFLGGRYGALALGDGRPPTHLQQGVEAELETARQELRRAADARYKAGRGEADVDAWEGCYDSALKLMKRKELFDEGAVSRQDRERYGTHPLGRHLLQARRLLEAGVLYTQVTSYHWDTHADNFAMHQELMPQIDKPYAALIDDLDTRGMLDNVVVILMAEFGRTPKINQRWGRDHWPEAWSIALAGAGIKRGVVVGKTSPDGAYVDESPFDAGHLFHTVFRAVGINPEQTVYQHNGQALAIAREDMEPMKGVLA